MPNSLFSHQSHAFFDRLLKMGIDHVACHDFLDQRVGGSSAKENNLARVVTFGDDADKSRPVHHHESADFLSAMRLRASNTVASRSTVQTSRPLTIRMSLTVFTGDLLSERTWLKQFIQSNGPGVKQKLK